MAESNKRKYSKGGEGTVDRVGRGVSGGSERRGGEKYTSYEMS